MKRSYLFALILATVALATLPFLPYSIPALPMISAALAAVVLWGLVSMWRQIAARPAAVQNAKNNAGSTVQSDILRLMNELEALADGDLAVRATVTEGETGVIADIVNYAIEELATMVRRVHTAATLVSTATQSSQQSCAVLLESIQHQKEHGEAAVQTVSKTAYDIREAAQNAAQAAEAAQNAAVATRNGEQAVRETINNMGEISHHIQETSKRLKRLGESSQEIGEVVALIAEISEQTNVLALNAGIHVASRQDDQQNFALVAEDIHQLAERANDASARIGRIAQSAQKDARQAISSMEAATSQVVQGVKLADSAGNSLYDISNQTGKSAQIINGLRIQIQNRSDEVIAIADKMTATLALIDETAHSTDKTVEAVDHVTELSKRLSNSVTYFRV